MPTLTYANPRNLPNYYRDWICWHRPLPQDVSFVQRRVKWFTILVGLVAGPVFVAGGLFMFLVMVRGLFLGPVDWVGLGLGILLGLLMIVAGLAGLWVARSEIEVLYARKKGPFRHGAFFGSHALLILVDDRTCHLIPRKSIQSVEVTVGRHKHVRLDLGYGVSVSFPSGSLREPDDLFVRRVESWAAGDG